MNDGNDTVWKFFLNSGAAWDAMYEAAAEAKSSIDFEQYIFAYDEVGRRFLDIFEKKSKEGVKVRLLIDEVGSFRFSRSPLPSLLKKAGISIKFFNSIVPWSPKKESLWYFRDHRKLMIVDNAIGFTGGACFAEEMMNWRESHVRIEGPVVKEMVASFEAMWKKMYYRPRFYRKNKAFPMLEEFSYVPNFPLPRKRHMYKELIRALTKARREILLTTPYFLPDNRLFRILKHAAKRGIAVSILIPKKPNHRITDWGSRTYFDEALEAGINIYRHNLMIHSKTGVIDSNWSTIGSLNLDNLSLRYNFEGNIVSTNGDFCREIREQFMTDLQNATKLHLDDWRKRPWTEKIFEWLVWPFRKLL